MLFSPTFLNLPPSLKHGHIALWDIFNLYAFSTELKEIRYFLVVVFMQYCLYFSYEPVCLNFFFVYCAANFTCGVEFA